MGRPNSTLAYLLLQAELDNWLEERDNPAPTLRWAAALWGGAGTRYGAEWAGLAERNARLWDSAYAYRLGGTTAPTAAMSRDLDDTIRLIVGYVQSNPLLHPAVLEAAMSSVGEGQ